MTQTKSALLSLIGELLARKPEPKKNNFEDYGDDMVELYEDTLLAEGMTRQYVEIALKELAGEGVIKTRQIFFAPERTLSNYDPDSATKYRVPADEIYKTPVHVLHINREKITTPKPSEPLSFDESESVLRFKGKVCEIDTKGVEYYFLKELFAHPFGARVKETDIADSFDNKADKVGSSRVYDAHRRINKRVKELFGIARLIGYKNATYWLNTS